MSTIITLAKYSDPVGYNNRRVSELVGPFSSEKLAFAAVAALEGTASAVSLKALYLETTHGPEPVTCEHIEGALGEHGRVRLFSVAAKLPEYTLWRSDLDCMPEDS